MSKKFLAIICISLLAVFLLLYSCTDYEQYPLEPVIEYQGYKVIYSNDTLVTPIKGVLQISFTDGDGNIGLSDNEVDPPYDYNLFIDYFELQNGVWSSVVVDGDTVNFNARIPIITPSGTNKNIKGTIYDTVLLNTFSSYDTIKYVIYLKDRDLNKSNIIETPEIVISE